MKLSEDQKKNFKQKIYRFYSKNKREFEWRKTSNPYRILVSEFMLQQTQTRRVEKKYSSFIETIPKIKDLSTTPFPIVLTLWQGLGYNRRALMLHKTAQIIQEDHSGKIPQDKNILLSLPGIGEYTAAALRVFAFHKADIVLETNIRSAFIFSFFSSRNSINDEEIKQVIEQTIDKQNPREWYYALMDYGAYLKKRLPFINQKSKSYTKQSKFKGSDREIRGKILKILLKGNHIRESNIFTEFSSNKYRVQKIISQLEKEGFLVRKKTKHNNIICIQSNM